MKMIKTRFAHFLFALVLAVLLAGMTLVAAQAQTAQPPATATPAPDGAPAVVSNNMTYDTCAGCHKDIYDTWKISQHGQSLADPVFAKAWDGQGKPGACLVCHTTAYDPTTGKSAAEGVSCQACHSPIPANHPMDNMPVDKSPDLCGKCHSDPRFATENWQLSAHYQRGMTCSVCHDAHTAGMKSVEGAAPSDDASALCANCHKDAMQNFPTSKHAEAGVTCVNCHLGFNVENNSGAVAVDVINVHKSPDHNFRPTLATCNKCHSSQMHAPGQAAAAAAIKIESAGGTPTPAPTAAVTPVSPVTSQPAPVSPVGFASMAGLLGLAGGMVLAPWLERLYRRYVKGEKHG
jgi:predicted CXXCH cytochrome family protein